VRIAGRQLAIMKVLWEHGEATVARILELLETEPPLAYSTVSTVLSRMEQKGLVAHRSEDRQYCYRAAVTQEQVGRAVVDDFVQHIFDGSPSSLVNHLLETDQVSAGELQRIKALIEEHEARLAKSRRRHQ
jgi:predicted transcriptional regulator